MSKWKPEDVIILVGVVGFFAMIITMVIVAAVVK
jgi:hypothetical protein